MSTITLQQVEEKLEEFRKKYENAESQSMRKLILLQMKPLQILKRRLENKQVNKNMSFGFIFEEEENSKGGE